MNTLFPLSFIIFLKSEISCLSVIVDTSCDTLGESKMVANFVAEMFFQIFSKTNYVNVRVGLIQNDGKQTHILISPTDKVLKMNSRQINEEIIARLSNFILLISQIIQIPLQKRISKNLNLLKEATKNLKTQLNFNMIDSLRAAIELNKEAQCKETLKNSWDDLSLNNLVWFFLISVQEEKYLLISNGGTVDVKEAAVRTLGWSS